MNLTDEVIESRFNDIETIKKNWGWKSKLAKKWGCQHPQQVTRFMKKYKKNLLTYIAFLLYLPI